MANYFMDSEEAIEHRINHPASLTQHKNNPGLNRDLVQLIDNIIRQHNIFAQAFEFMHEVETHIYANAIQAGIKPPEVQLLFTMANQADVHRCNLPTTNEISAVIILNADGSIPNNDIIMHPRIPVLHQNNNLPQICNSQLHKTEITIRQRGKELRVLSNMDPWVEPFVYPLFYPSGTYGWHDGLTYDMKQVHISA